MDAIALLSFIEELNYEERQKFRYEKIFRKSLRDKSNPMGLPDAL